MRRLWACVVAKLEDNHERRTVMANAKANAAEMKAWADTSIETAADIWPVDWFPVAPPIPVETDMPPTDFDG